MAHLLILDDHIQFAQGTRTLLVGAGHSADLYSYIEDLGDARLAHDEMPYDVAFVDLVFAGQQLSVLDALDALSGWQPVPKVVMLTAGGESRRHFIETALSYSNVKGGMPKSAPADALVRCLDAVLGGEESFDHEISLYRPASHRPPPEELLQPERHALIWFALARGATTHETIGAQVGIRPKTAQNTIRPMGDKLADFGLAPTDRPRLNDLIRYATLHREWFAAMELRQRRRPID